MNLVSGLKWSDEEKRRYAKRRAKREAKARTAIPRIISLFDQGFTTQQISNRVGLTPFNVCCILEKAGRQP